MPAAAILKVPCYLLLTLHKTRQDHPVICLKKYYTSLWAGVAQGAYRQRVTQLRKHKGINNLDSVLDKTKLRNNSPPKPHQNFNLYRLLAP